MERAISRPHFCNDFYGLLQLNLRNSAEYQLYLSACNSLRAFPYRKGIHPGQGKPQRANHLLAMITVGITVDLVRGLHGPIMAELNDAFAPIQELNLA